MSNEDFKRYVLEGKTVTKTNAGIQEHINGLSLEEQRLFNEKLSES